MNNQKSQCPDIRRIAIVGSGLAGLSAAQMLTEQGATVTVFEKSRGPGGRLAAKRVNGGSADIGAQYFTIRSREFRRFLDQHAGPAAYSEWRAKLGYQTAEGQWQSFPDEARYVGTPRMTAISRAVSNGLDLRVQTRIARLARNDQHWTLTDTDNQIYGPFDAVIVTAPPAQARDLLADSQLPALAAELDKPVLSILPCWAVAARFEQSPCDDYDGFRPDHDALYWAGNNSSKPGRDDQGQWWVLHGTPGWSAANENSSPETVASALVDAFRDVTGTSAEPVETVTHRWLYARSAPGDQPGCRWFESERIGLAGDWLCGGRVEGAFESALALVAAMGKG